MGGLNDRIKISIHAPHEGERLMGKTSSVVTEPISIHAPHEGERHFYSYIKDADGIFQSTLPTRGSDICVRMRRAAHVYFNPRSPRGGATAMYRSRNKNSPLFQSTLPTRGSDRIRQRAPFYPCHFNPRSPRGGATMPRHKPAVALTISIHAPPEGERRKKSK